MFPNITLKFHYDCSFIKLDAFEVNGFFLSKNLKVTKTGQQIARERNKIET